jgi:hypothetical protein
MGYAALAREELLQKRSSARVRASLQQKQPPSGRLRVCGGALSTRRPQDTAAQAPDELLARHRGTLFRPPGTPPPPGLAWKTSAPAV